MLFFLQTPCPYGINENGKELSVNVMNSYEAEMVTVKHLSESFIKTGQELPEF